MAIALTLSAAARERLAHDLPQTGLSEPLASVLWAEGRSGKTPGAWCIGYYEATRVPASAQQEIEGIRFAFVQGNISERLNGKTLDFQQGNYVVV
jgi:hypothetical protein